MQKPTPQAVVVMELACLLLGKKPKKAHWNKVEGDEKGFYYTASQQLLSKPDEFLKSMQEYDKDHMAEKVVKRVSALLQKHEQMA
jgi:hypothetical protein